LLICLFLQSVPENINTHPREAYWKFQRGGRGVSQAKIFKGKYEQRLEFSEGWVSNQKKKCGRGICMNIFWNNSIGD